MYLGRIVQPDEPEWLPEDRDIVHLVQEFDAQANSCGHWDWQADDVEGLEPGYKVCKLCTVLGPYEKKIREQNRKRGQDEHGLTFGWFAPREEDD